MAASTPAPARRLRLVLTLGSTPYTVRPVPAAEMPPGAVRAFTPTRTDPKLGEIAHLVIEGIDGLGCSCGDSTYRQSPTGGRCKHIAACEASGWF